MSNITAVNTAPYKKRQSRVISNDICATATVTSQMSCMSTPILLFSLVLVTVSEDFLTRYFKVIYYCVRVKKILQFIYSSVLYDIFCVKFQPSMFSCLTNRILSMRSQIPYIPFLFLLREARMMAALN